MRVIRDRVWFSLLAAVGVAMVVACGPRSAPLSATQRRAIVDTLTREVEAAYDFSKPGVEQRLLSLYPDTGRVISASAGRLTASRDTIAMGIGAFWDNVGVNMRQPRWIWDQMLFDVLAPDAAVMTATYHVPHLTPSGEPHTIGGAWTAVFQKRGGKWVIIQEHLSDLPPMPMAMDSMAMPMAGRDTGRAKER